MAAKNRSRKRGAFPPVEAPQTPIGEPKTFAARALKAHDGSREFEVEVDEDQADVVIAAFLELGFIVVQRNARRNHLVVVRKE